MLCTHLSPADGGEDRARIAAGVSSPPGRGRGASQARRGGCFTPFARPYLHARVGYPDRASPRRSNKARPARLRSRNSRRATTWTCAKGPSPSAPADWARSARVRHSAQVEFAGGVITRVRCSAPRCGCPSRRGWRHRASVSARSSGQSYRAARRLARYSLRRPAPARCRGPRRCGRARALERPSRSGARRSTGCTTGSLA